MLGAVEDGQSVQVGQFVLEWLHTPGLREGGREETGCKARERGGEVEWAPRVSVAVFKTLNPKSYTLT